MTAPTVVALETDSAWVVILVVSLVTLPLILLLRRLINRPGGFASGLLLSLPLALPLLAAMLYQNSVLPEISVLRPPTLETLTGSGGGLERFFLLRDATTHTFIPYALNQSTGSWLLLLGVSVSSFMLLRRLVGAVAMRGLIRRSISPAALGRPELDAVVADVAERAGLRRVPQLLILPERIQGAFAMGGGGGRILLARDLIECFDADELEATIAHELAHLQARDVRLVVVAGMLRDLMAWNPVAHIAFRKLSADRELEADRRAADLTGNPLAVASGLLKMCELIRSRGTLQRATALGFWPARGRLSRRLTNMLALADGRASLGSTSALPFLAAALLAAALSLQVGMRMTSGEGGALALVLGVPSSSDALLWADDSALGNGRGRVAAHPEKETAKRDRKAVVSSPLFPPNSGLAASQVFAVRAGDLPRWFSAMTAEVKSSGVPEQAIRTLEKTSGWRAQPVFSTDAIGPVGLYQIESVELFPSGGSG